MSARAGPKRSATLTDTRLRALAYLYDNGGTWGPTHLGRQYGNCMSQFNGGYTTRGWWGGQRTYMLSDLGTATVEWLRAVRDEERKVS